MAAPALSVVIPVRNDERALVRLLESLDGRGFEVIVIDGQSSDASLAAARQFGAEAIRTAPGRGHQLNLGVQHSTGDWIWMLHADSEVSEAVLGFVQSLPVKPGWGRFDVRLKGQGAGIATVAFFMNLRSRLTGICTGDQGIFAHRETLKSAGGVPEQALMEDIELSKRLKKISAPICSNIKLGASARRWESRGLVSTILTMWGFRLAYWFGADPEDLARRYYS